MKFKIIMGSIASLAMLTIFIAGQTWQQKRVKEQFSCRAALVQHIDGFEVTLSLKFMFKDGYGTVALNGRSSIGKKLQTKFNRKIYFTWLHDGEFYPLTSQKILKYPDDNVSDEWLGRFFPKFYSRSGEDVYLNIIRQANGNNIFFIETIPVFSCKEIKMAGS